MKRLLLSLFLLAGMASPSMAADLSIVSLTSTTAGAISTTGSVVVSQTGVGVRNLPIPELNVLLNISATSTKTLAVLISTTINNSGLGTFGSLSVTGTTNIFGATTLSGPVTMSSTLNVTGLLSGVAGNFSTSLSSALITPTTLNVLGNSTFTGTSALLGFVGVGVADTLYPLDVRFSTTTATQLHLSNTTGTDNGMYFWASGNVANVMAGGTFTNNAYRARGTAAGFISFNNGVLAWAGNSGLTYGNTFTPNTHAQFSGQVGTENVINEQGLAVTTRIEASGNANAFNLSGTTGNIGIGAAPIASARLAITSTNSGFLPPVVTTTQQNAIGTPATGLFVFNSTAGEYQFYNGSAWTGLATASVGESLSIGTLTLSNALTFSNSAGGRFTATGKAIGIATLTPSQTSRLNIGAGDASNSQIVLDASVLTTTPQAGSVGYDGTNLKVANTAGTWSTVTTQTVLTGTYTPTVTNVTNMAASTAYVCNYTRVGDVVSVSGRVDLDPTDSGSATTQADVSLPIASNLTSSVDLAGVGGSFAAGTAGTFMAVTSETTNDRAVLLFKCTDSNNNGYFINFTYPVK